MLRIATIGTSMITDDFIQVVNANDQAAFVGTLSRDADRGAAFTAKHGGERNFTAIFSGPSDILLLTITIFRSFTFYLLLFQIKVPFLVFLYHFVFNSNYLDFFSIFVIPPMYG